MPQSDDIQSLARRLVEPLRGWFLSYGSAYDSGLYTPSYFGGTTAGVTTYNTNGQVGEWVRVGDMVTVWAKLDWTGATGTGDARILLPFTARNTTGAQYAGSARISAVTYAGDWVSVLVSPNATFAILQTATSNAGATTLQVEAAGVIAIQVTYPIAL
jgi:hypothetical protein